MSKPVSSWAELEKMIMGHVNDALQHEVAGMVKNKIKEHVQTDVYNEYPEPEFPIIYERRHLENGSLGDIEQMDSKLVNNGVLEVIDNADFNHEFAARAGGYGGVDRSKSLSYNIEYGYAGKAFPYNKPRPFIEKTREEIQGNNLHITTMKKALQTRLGSDAVK